MTVRKMDMEGYTRLLGDVRRDFDDWMIQEKLVSKRVYCMEWDDETPTLLKITTHVLTPEGTPIFENGEPKHASQIVAITTDPPAWWE